MLKYNSKETKVWFTSDTHYWHKNIVKAISVWKDPEDNCRDFQTTQEMSSHIVDQINKYVGQDDVLIHLGDWSFGGINNIWNFRNRINCKNIHLVYGNHDKHIIENRTLPNCWYDIDDNIVGIADDFGIQVCAQELFNSTQDYLEVQIDKTLICNLHYPMEEWNDRFKMSYHLFGHVHGRIPHGNGRCDMGMDNAYKIFGEYRPFEYPDIVRILGKPNRAKDNKVVKNV